jgi:alpha-glucosidase (family GH31 glycosyl hydrolase)
MLCQEKRTILAGKVMFNNNPIADVHIINKNTTTGTISNGKGLFEIPVRAGDSIYFSHLNLEERRIIISQTNSSKDTFTIQLTEKTYALDEIRLEKSRSILYIESIPNNTPIVNATTLRLPYANSIPKKDNSVFKVRSGGLISIDNLINSLNGNNRRKKLLNKLAKEDAELSQIRKYFTDDFFVSDLKIKKEYINQFLNYCVNKGGISTFKIKNKIELTKLLLEESKAFPHKIENENLFFSKN